MSPFACRAFLFIATVFSVALPLGAQSAPALWGTVTDVTGAVVPNAQVTWETSYGATVKAKTDAAGRYRFESLPEGSGRLRVAAAGFGPASRNVTASRLDLRIDVALQPARVSDAIEVIGERLLENDAAADRVPGSVEVLGKNVLEPSHVFNFSEALRKVGGVNVRDEEGFGLRPNIGIRGLNPTRSSKVLLLEDGIPLAYSVYGDNASYYHPPVERFESLEVLKGSGQILYGPVTVGGVINYLTPDPPEKLSGKVTLLGGNRNYFNGWALVGGTYKGTGWLVDYQRKQGDGSRQNIRSGLNDATIKLSHGFGAHQVTLKGNFYGEDSNVAYSGLRLSEYEADPRQNPFRNDFFAGRRHGASLRHSVALGSNMLFSTNLYGAVFTRDWWRQSSNSGQRPNDAADLACGGMANLNTTCGNEGRLRQYQTIGFDPHLRIDWKLFGIRSQTDLGFRGHFEKQYRLQFIGPLPTSRSGVKVEDNIRRTQAYSTFLQNKFTFGKLAITPGVRIEQINHSRNNRLANAGLGTQGFSDVTQAVPGIGAAYALHEKLTLFGGVHRGFAPPRAEDLVTNTGGVIELDPELSWNIEAGFRSTPFRGFRLDATYFRMDYENQIIPASLAGGIGATLTNGGATLHEGFEVTSRLDAGVIFGTRYNFFAGASFTHLPVARLEGERFSNIPGFTSVRVTGNRLPYAPANTLTGNFGYAHPRGWDVSMEAVFVGDQFGDDLNTVASSADGQRGLLPGNTTWNGVVNYRVEKWNSTFFVAVKNIFDDTYIVDRSRGMLPSSPRLIQSGLRYSW